MRVLYDGFVYQFAPSGGVFLYFNELIPRIAATPDTQVEILTTTKNAPLPAARGIEVHTVALPQASWIPEGRIKNTLRALKPSVQSSLLKLQAARKDSATVFHSTYYAPHPSRRLPQVFTIHDMIPELFPEFSDLPHTKKIIFDKKKCIARASQIITVSEKSKQDLCDMYALSPNLVKAIPHGIRHELFSDTQNTSRPFDSKYLLYVGGRLHHKNFNRAAEAFALLPSRKELPLLVAGLPWTENERTLLKALGIEKQVQLLKSPTDEQLRMLYRHAEALIYPSLYEGFGLPVLEAMASATPVAAANVGSIPEVGGDAVEYFDPRDPQDIARAIEKVLTTEVAARLKIAGPIQAQKFSWEKCAQQTMETYKKALGEL